MPAMPLARQPIVDYDGGTVVSLHVTGLLHEDATALRGSQPLSVPACDSLRLTGAATAQVGAAGVPQSRTLVPQNLGVSIGDRHPQVLDREIFRTFVPAGTDGPAAVHAALLLTVEQWDGTTRDAAAQDALDEMAPLVEKAMTTVVDREARDTLEATVVRAGTGSFGWTVPNLVDALPAGPRDDFALCESSLVVPRGDAVHVLGQESVVTDLTAGSFRLSLEWRVRNLPPVDEILNLQVHYGEYVVAEGGGRQTLIANRPSASDWETFGLVRLGDDRVALLAPNGDFLSAEGGGGREIFAGRPYIGEWEVFRVETVMEDRIALRAFNGHYVSAYHGGGRELVASRPVRDEYEVFTLHRR